MNSLFRVIIDKDGPADKPDEPKTAEDVEDWLPAEVIAQDPTDWKRYDGTHLKHKLNG